MPGVHTVDGGRDAIGRYLLGLSVDPVYAEFALEAKCYQPSLPNKPANTVGVREVSRLISRIRHREFGVLVTTSFIARQAYEEVREDRHPIVMFSGGDIANVLVTNALNTVGLVTALHSSIGSFRFRARALKAERGCQVVPSKGG